MIYYNDKKFGSRTYRYAVHAKDGKVLKQCYLGPTHGYVAVTGLHETFDMALESMVVPDVERVQHYLEGLCRAIENLDLSQ